MQAIIMAAGKGTRLGAFTENTPKCLLRIKGKRLIDINLAVLHRFGIWDITIVTGFQDRKISEAVGEIPGIRLVYNPFYEFTNVLGSYYMGMKYLHDDFLYLHADTICESGIFYDLLRDGGDVVLPVEAGSCDDEAMKVRLDRGKVIEITKQMPPEKALGEFIGIAKIRKNVIETLNNSAEEILRNGNFTSYFEAALQKVIDTGKYDFRIIETSGRFWREIDFPEDYEKAERNISTDLVNF